MAFDYLIRTFPFSPPVPGYLEPRVILVHQLYALVHDRTAVDVDLAQRRQSGSIIVMRVTALGLDDYALMRVEEYREIVDSMIDAKVRRLDALKREAAQSPAPSIGEAAPASLLAPNTRLIKRKRPQEKGEAGKRLAAGAEAASPPAPSGPPSASAPPSLSIAASSPITRPPPLSPVHSANQQLPPPQALVSVASSPSERDKENLSTPSPFLIPEGAAERLADEATVLRLLLSSLLPNHRDVSITRSQLLRYLYSPGAYLGFTADDVISTLFHHQLLVSAPAMGEGPGEVFWMGLPHVGGLWREVLDVRVEVQRLVRKTRYGEVRRSELEKRVRVKGSERGMRWHLLEMIGGGRLLEAETTKGTMMRIPREETRRR